MSAELDELIAEQVSILSPSLVRRFPRVPREDLEQQAWVMILPHREQLQAQLDAGEADKVKHDIHQHAVKGGLSLTRQEDQQDRAVKALTAGYETSDECFYSVPLLRRLVAAYLDHGITDEAPKGREAPQRGSGDPAESGNWRTAMIDVDFAFWKLSKDQRKTLSRYFSYPQGSGGWTHIEIASAMGVQPTVLDGRVKRALRAMQRKLGGPNPWFRG